MADIELAIKIPENTYKRIQALVRDEYFEHDICGNSMQRIAHGTPLPKGHGRLIDTTNLIEEVKARCDNPAQVIEVINDEMAIIEADKENKE